MLVRTARMPMDVAPLGLRSPNVALGRRRSDSRVSVCHLLARYRKRNVLVLDAGLPDEFLESFEFMLLPAVEDETVRRIMREHETAEEKLAQGPFENGHAFLRRHDGAGSA